MRGSDVELDAMGEVGYLCMVIWLFLFIYLVIWFSINSVLWIRSTRPARYWGYADLKNKACGYLKSFKGMQKVHR